ncbi:porin [Paraburkholderia solisilvae]|uniref:Outer membrane porin protein 32 n=1 Tax=Paraburkholderia solisilvae TaxID=624376 RepID=A0A6J5E0N3_9BURK|nr:porin [Paraburkholderia solisilvae]CAB3759527.1 Outer membrane porin protein 32 [Paraburkholderia solisilvae]
MSTRKSATIMKPLLFGVFSASVSVGAYAQSSVTLYGIADAGIEFLTGAPNAQGKASNLLREESGGAKSSRIGLKGSEDLGGGLKAIFQLEGGIDLTSGKSQQSGRLFGRQAYVGLSSRYGALTFGRQRVPMYDFSVAYDPLAYNIYGLKQTDGQFTGRADNSVKYKGRVGPVSYEALYSTGFDATIENGGEVPGAFKVGREIGAAVQYASGPFSAMVVYDLRNGTSVLTQSEKEQHLAAAATYQIGKAKGFVGYRWLSSTLPLDPTTQGHADEFWGGVSYRVIAPLTVAGAVFWTDITSAGQRPIYLAATAKYSLSKRTVLYSELGYVKNSHGSNLGLNGYDTDVVADHNQTGVMLGVTHYF